LRTESEIRKEIEKIENDGRYIAGQESPGNTEDKALLALIQFEVETRVMTLEWVLREGNGQ